MNKKLDNKKVFFIMRLFVLFIVSAICGCARPVLDKKSAIHIAEDCLREQYRASINRYRPFQAKLHDGQWEVIGSLPEGEFNFPMVVIRQTDGHITFIGFSVH